VFDSLILLMNDGSRNRAAGTARKAGAMSLSNLDFFDEYLNIYLAPFFQLRVKLIRLPTSDKINLFLCYANCQKKFYEEEKKK